MQVMKSPRSLDLSITNRCNLRCTYCSHFSSAAEVDGDLPTPQWLAFLEELGRAAVLNLTLEGGEPLLREDFEDIVRGIVRNRMRFDILSNGTLVTDELAAFLASTRRCNQVQVSIDGSHPESHDACRGPGTFVRAVAGLRALMRHRVPVTVRVTIHKHNIDDLEETARFLLERLGIPSISTNSAGHMGLCRLHADRIQLSVEEHSRAMATLLRLDRRYPGRISASAGPLAEAKTWAAMEQARRRGADPFSGCGFLAACGGVMSKMAVRADGVMVPCTQMSHIELGHINRDALTEVWQHHPELNRLRERHRVPLGEFGFCRGCDYIPYCTGNCPALAYTLAGEDHHPSPDACLKRFLEEGGRLPDEDL